MSREAGDGDSTILIGIVLSLVADIIVNIGMNSMKYAHNVNINDDGEPVKSFLLVPCCGSGCLGS